MIINSYKLPNEKKSKFLIDFDTSYNNGALRKPLLKPPEESENEAALNKLYNSPWYNENKNDIKKGMNEFEKRYLRWQREINKPLLKEKFKKWLNETKSEDSNVSFRKMLENAKYIFIKIYLYIQIL